MKRSDVGLVLSLLALSCGDSTVGGSDEMSAGADLAGADLRMSVTPLPDLAPKEKL